MGVIYSVEFNSVAVTVAQDLFQIEAITVPIKIHMISISQISDVGDSAAESLLIRLRGGITDAVTDDLAAVPYQSARATANLSDLAINETSQLTTAAVDVYSEGWNIALPFIWLPPPEDRYEIQPTDAFVVDLATAPADSLTMSGTVIFEEL